MMNAAYTSLAASASASSSSSTAADQPAFAPPATFGNILGASADRRPFDEHDPRVYFDQAGASWRCEIEAENGEDVELEWNALQQSWTRVIDDDVLRQQQAAYSVKGVDEATPAAPVLRRQEKKRRRRAADEDDDDADAQTNKHRKRVNTSVYVTGLPLDCTREEVAKVFARYGVLNEDDEGQARVKMYADPRTGAFKGEALVTYFKPDSVDLAINVLDESALRALEGKTHPIMRVSKAEFGIKDNNLNAQEVARDSTSEQTLREVARSGNDVSSSRQNQPQSHAPQQQGRAPLSGADKKRAQKRYAKMNNKLLDWTSDSDDDNDKERAGGTVQSTLQQSDTTTASTKVRQVCLRRMFTLAELEDDPTLLLDLKEDVREECESFGKVTSVTLWDREPEGIMTVKFATHEAAMACIQKMDARFFAGRQIIAEVLQGKARFRRSDRDTADYDDLNNDDNDDDYDDGDDADERKRHDAFGDWLEGKDETS